LHKYNVIDGNKNKTTRFVFVVAPAGTERKTDAR
jgi:hypothetical protein